MTRIIIQNTSILTLDNHDTFFYPGVIEIRDDRIFSIGTWSPDAILSEYGGETRIIDGTDKVVMPGLVDLHFHTSVAKGYGDDLPLWEYLDRIWYPSIRALTPETCRTAALHSYITALKSGTTTVNDMYRHLDSLASAALQTGIRAVISNDIALPEHNLDSVADNVQAYHRNNNLGNGRIKVWLGLEWLPLSDAPLLAEIGKMKKELGTGVHIHLCESRTEIENSIKRFRKRPVDMAYEAGILGPDCVAAHCVHLSDNEIKLLAETGTSVSHNAGSNAKLGNGVARVQDMVKAGINIGLGVDACECHNSVDMFETMKITSYMQRATLEDASLGHPSQILRMGTSHGAKALGIDAGMLVVGKKADVILLDLKKDMMFTPLHKEPEQRRRMLESHLVFGCNGSAVDTVIVDGRIVVEGKKVLGVDQEQARVDMDALFHDLVASMPEVTVDREKGA
ncbi:related to 5-methylthioadenosine/S-adenosylhomocysteine deaminase [Phialocephala subalpina]|uniref:Related to 5-methylthioadenosine/S-adenosylhomocysteine deaminase n=1 Tax=Phialocephala subalpina TaxID=576137 RepID=A0A1L7WTI3_9HELO|nr:related to 5-methylthioadenosine/S-adenosylhomocysteine deaminase [Phialocephala subalpina]